MTGFGRGATSGSDFEIAVELKTVNNRFLDVAMKLPGDLQSLEAPLKRLISARLARGRVDVSIQFERTHETTYDLNRPLIASYLEAMKLMKNEFGIAGEPDINMIARLPNVLQVTKSEIGEEFLLAAGNAVAAALDDLEKMRHNEGEMLAAELAERLGAIERYLDVVEEESANVADEYRERLTKRIGDLFSKTDTQIEIDQGRLAQEVAYLADRSDISEEIARLRTHIEHFRAIMQENKEVGKRLDFLTQELNREANTITSKTNNMTVKENALEIKSEIEKIREQVQNVE